jgi:OmpA-OmpF porin, OOP family
VPTSKISADKNLEKSTIALSVPVGGGFRFRISDRSTLGIEAYTRMVLSDYLDGVSQSGNPEQNDWFFSGMVSFSHAFGSRKVKVREEVAAVSNEPAGVTDEPVKEKKKEKGKSKEKSDNTDMTDKGGVADRDADGVPDDKDECPDDKGIRTLKGCPDRDKDGVADGKDDCPETPGKLDLGGCPDGDNDGVADKNDACPTVAGVAAYRGCPPVDRDKDGVADAEDLCPDMAGDLKWNGCADNDGDGLPDNKDNCPGIAGPATTKGCPDGDGDGVADLEDDCPTTPGIIAKKGCPESSTAPGVKVPYKAVYFNTKLQDWYETSYTTLEEVVTLMKENPKLLIRIEGNTDNTGDNPANNLLSEQRAKKCYDYLVAKGIDGKRMTYMGFADRRPVATNSTKEGRQLNRRVEIHFYQ